MCTIKKIFLGVLVSSSTLLFAHEDNTIKKNIEQYVAQLYQQKPYLKPVPAYLTMPTMEAQSTKNRSVSFIKKYGLDLGMLAYCAYNMIRKHQQIYAQNALDSSNHSWIQKKLFYFIPNHMVTVSHHTTFFLDSLEIIFKAFLVKTLIKILFFCVTLPSEHKKIIVTN